MDLETYIKFAYGRWPKSVLCDAAGTVNGNICGVTAVGTANAVFEAGCVAEETSGYAPAEDDVATLNIFLPMSLSTVKCKSGQLQVFFFPDASATRWDNLA